MIYFKWRKDFFRYHLKKLCFKNADALKMKIPNEKLGRSDDV